MYATRPARYSDLPALARLEEKAWAGRGTPALSYAELAAWLAEGSPLFLVAEDADGVCAYTFSRMIDFRFDAEGIARFLDPALMTGKGMSNHPMNPDGEAAYGISIASIRPDAGKSLAPLRHEILELLRLPYFLTFSRLSGFDAYVRSVEESHGGELPCSLDELALWYVHEHTRLCSMREWKEAKPKPALNLPEVNKIDPVLGFHAKHTKYGILDIMPGHLTDPSSRNYGVGLLSVYPHR